MANFWRLVDQCALSWQYGRFPRLQDCWKIINFATEDYSNNL